MRKKILLWVIVILIVSGWFAFLIEYIISHNKIAQIKAKNLALTNQLKYVNSVSKNLNATINFIDKTITDLQGIKTGLVETKNKLEIVGNTQNTTTKSNKK